MTNSANVFEIEFLSKFLPYKTFDPKTKLFHNENTTGFVLRGRPMVGAHLKDQENLAEFFRRREWLKEGTSLQFLLVANPKCDRLLNWWANSRKGGLYKDLATRRIDHLNALSKETPVNLPLVRDYQLFISYTLPHKTSSFMEEEAIVEIRDQLQEKVRTLGIPTKTMDASDLVQSFGEILSLNDDPTTPFSWNKYEDISKQMCQPDQVFSLKKEVLEMDKGYHFKAFVPKNTPSHWSLLFMDKFLGEGEREGLDFPFMIHYGLTICDAQGTEKAKALAKRESYERSLKSQLGKFMPQLKDQYEESLEVVEELQRGEQLCYASLSVGVFAKPEKMAKATSRFLAQMNRIGFEFVPTTFNHFPMLLSMMPMTWTYGVTRNTYLPWVKNTNGYGRSLYELKRAKKTITKESQNLLPLLGEWTGQNAPGIPLIGRQGQLFFLNFFGEAFLPDARNVQTSGNYNAIVAGQSGSGKSVLLQEIANNTLSVGGKAFIMDVGRSFEKYCQLMGGQHIVFDFGKPQSINFFTNLPDGGTEEDLRNRADCLNCIQSTTKSMVSPNGILGNLESSYIDEAVDHVAKNINRGGDVNCVRDYLLSQKNRVAKELAQRLYPYSKEGRFGGFFMGDATLTFDAPLSVTEMENLRNYPDFTSVCTQMLTINFNQRMLRSDKRAPSTLILDELELLLSGMGCADFIPNATRTSRKYKGSIVMATQLLTDYFKESCPAATAAFNTASWKIIMNQPSDAIEAWRHHPQLREYVSSEGLLNHMKSVHTRTPYYAEAAIFNEGLKGVIGRLSLDPFSRILYSTNADEFRQVQDYASQGMSLTNAIEAVVREQEGLRH